jgi:hypothetical protein
MICLPYAQSVGPAGRKVGAEIIEPLRADPRRHGAYPEAAQGLVLLIPRAAADGGEALAPVDDQR